MGRDESQASESISQMTDEHLLGSPDGSRFPRGESTSPAIGASEAHPGAVNIAFDIAGEAMAFPTDAEISEDGRTLCWDIGEYKGVVLGQSPPASNQRSIENIAARSVGPQVERMVQAINRIMQEAMVS